MTGADPGPLATAPPFVWLEDSRGSGPSRLYARPVGIVEAATLADVEPALAALRAATRNGLHAAGWIGYEASYAFEPRLAALPPLSDGPLLWFGLFRQVRLFSSEETEALWQGERPVPRSPLVAGVRPRLTGDDYLEAVRQVQRLIGSGDVYQVNLTFLNDVSLDVAPLEAYAVLREGQRVAYGAFIDMGERQILSFSPELFFRIDKGRLTARPMKGTSRRQPTPGADQEQARFLMCDPKNRAENLMIVDLMRNDVARVSVPGSVAVPSLFAVEQLRQVHQMTSTVTAALSPGLDVIDALRALSPCGSITGAPKIRAMEIIRQMEREPRGIYCGAIGWIDPGGDAAFNVAIRTLDVRPGVPARLGLGAGIVADSDPAAEWAECRLKGAFVQQPPPPFDLIETLLWRPDGGFWLLDEHLLRLAASARYWDFALDEPRLRAEAAALARDWRTVMRVRLLLARTGEACWQASPLGPAPAEPVALAIAPVVLRSDDPFLAHKTSNRAFYDDTRIQLSRQTGCFEVLFTNQNGEMAEGSFTTLFIERDDLLLTPPLASGALSGILRRHLITAGRAREAVLFPQDLLDAKAIHIGNSVRGLIRARLGPTGVLPVALEQPGGW